MIVIFFAQAMGAADGVRWQSFYPAVLFVWLTYSNYTTLQSYHGGWH